MITQDATYVEYDAVEQRTIRLGTARHHHCLSPTCFYNDTGKEVILLETPQGNFYCDTTPALQQELEKRAYQQAQGDFGAGTHEALEMVKEYTRTKTLWHFHIARPRCLLNDSNAFKLILEDDSKKDVKKWLFDEKPVALVRAIDDYYLGRKK